MKSSDRIAAVVAITLLGALTACSSSVGGEAANSSGTANMSTAQAAAMADGKVTQDEYQEGFRRYQSCMKKAGWVLTTSDDGGYLINYSFPTAGAKDDSRCYALEFQAIDQAWQIANIDRSDTTMQLRQCLVNAGITPRKTRAEIDDQLAAASIKPETCFSK